MPISTRILTDNPFDARQGLIAIRTCHDQWVGVLARPIGPRSVRKSQKYLRLCGWVAAAVQLLILSVAASFC